MGANTSPIFTLTPKVSSAPIVTTYAQVKSDGTCGATSNDMMVLAFTTGANGSYVDRIVFKCVANTAATTSVPTTLRAYWTTVAAAAATTQANCHCIGEVGVPAISASNSTAATQDYILLINQAFPANVYINVSQHVAQTTNQIWKATVYGGDYQRLIINNLK